MGIDADHDSTMRGDKGHAGHRGAPLDAYRTMYRRLHKHCGDISPAELEDAHYRHHRPRRGQIVNKLKLQARRGGLTFVGLSP